MRFEMQLYVTSFQIRLSVYCFFGSQGRKSSLDAHRWKRITQWVLKTHESGKGSEGVFDISGRYDKSSNKTCWNTLQTFSPMTHTYYPLPGR